jgi:hypothetical protein
MCFDYEMLEKQKPKKKDFIDENIETTPELEKIHEQPLVTSS